LVQRAAMLLPNSRAQGGRHIRKASLEQSQRVHVSFHDDDFVAFGLSCRVYGEEVAVFGKDGRVGGV